MPSSSFGGDTPTQGDPNMRLQPVPLDGLKWAGEPWDEELPVGDFEYVDERPAYVKNQVIVTGRQDDVRAVVSEALGQTKMLRDPISLEQLLHGEALRRFPDEDQGAVIIDLYETGDLSVRRAVERIYEQAVSMGRAVFADPNYVTGHPYIPVGSPYIPVGSPANVAEAAEDDFWEQWAFKGQNGIGLTERGQRSSSLNYTGAGSRVAVFDTSPFENSGPWAIPWITPNLELSVSHLLGSAQTTTPTADHGLFVAGLVHAVAPESQIELIQVLNEEALGDLDTLNWALAHFMLQRLSDVGTLNNTVMNLSLGFPQAHHLADFGLADLSTWFMNLINSLGTGEGPPPADAVAVVCLETLLLGAELLGAIVVAAAGNESSPQGAVPAEAPAAYPSVIGVAASNGDQKRSCFSNEGDVAAPGGDTCDPSTGQCLEDLVAPTENAVIGLAPHTSPATGYAYWAGTSFSAPLVSGLAALMLEHTGVAPTLGSISVKDPVLPQDPSLGKGIIDIPANLP